MANTATKPKKETTDQDDVKLELEILREDIARLTKTVADYGKSQGNHLKAVAKGHAKDAQAKGQEAADRVVRKAEDTYHDAEAAIRENPGAAVGIAAGLGFLVGMLMTRRS